MILCGNPLPWVSSLKHLGTQITNSVDGCQQDIKQKIASYIHHNCNLNQEFKFAHPDTRIKVNGIYNCHFSGSQLCDLSSSGVASFEAAFNRSVKVMADLPYPTHRYIVGSLAGGHMKVKIMKNYLGFIKRVRESPKFVLRQLYQLASNDTRTVTGSNLRSILVMTNMIKVADLYPGVVDKIKYLKAEESELWRLGLIGELLDIKYGIISPPNGWSEADLEKVLNVTCSQ